MLAARGFAQCPLDYHVMTFVENNLMTLSGPSFCHAPSPSVFHPLSSGGDIQALRCYPFPLTEPCRCGFPLS